MRDDHRVHMPVNHYDDRELDVVTFRYRELAQCRVMMRCELMHHVAHLD
jgi:hypothetical protein